MIIYAIDDEDNALTLIERSLRKAKETAEIYTFANPEAAFDKAKTLPPDVAFLDIRMPGINGMELAGRLKEIHPKVNIIFTTGYSEYMKDVFPIHPSGYITKPVTASKVEKELNNLLYPVDPKNYKIYAKAFGYFELFVDGKPVVFKRQKSKELLALLVDKEGSALKTEQIAAYLFEDKAYDKGVKNQIGVFISDLRRTLEEAGAGDILIRSWGQLQVDTAKFSCDAYDYLKGIPEAINMFGGEYMSGYEWAEETSAKFYWKRMK